MNWQPLQSLKAIHKLVDVWTSNSAISPVRVRHHGYSCWGPCFQNPLVMHCSHTHSHRFWVKNGNIGVRRAAQAQISGANPFEMLQ